ncbi:sensor domain-containing diguanylate cyclase [Aliidiomarina iranensis]|uniref:Sensor domain-containing diguanylate cyclase n=1 Tax=Aliidiomarina iranensis TaxID=1434071 RepID=A0A432VZR7_9GAMM|nr:sensor domain-containing diguanylate cyclase [Aliidiomarina iranensis]RUO22259.1 sensor domain-containing diguanylate cyclase [Aliidiomarina iranensis]
MSDIFLLNENSSEAEKRNLSRLVNTAVEQSFNGVLITDAKLGPDGQKILFANSAFAKMTGYSQTELMGKTPRILQGPKTDWNVIAELRKALAAGEHFTGVSVNYRKDGTSYDVEWRISPVRNESNQISHFISIQQDISDLKQSNKSVALLAEALDAAQVAIIIVDLNGRIEFANQGFEQLVGYSSEEAKGQDARFIKTRQGNEEYYANLLINLERDHVHEARSINLHKNGLPVYCDEKISPLHSDTGEVTHYVAVMKNVTKQMLRETELEEQASTDPLTSLANRRAGQAKLEAAYEIALDTGEPFCVIMADIDHFKPINDDYGHQRGDEILREISKVILQGIRSSDVAVRWGGEEFLILLHKCTSTDVEKQIDSLREKIAKISFSDVGTVTMSFGIASFRKGEKLEDLISRADKAMYAAKKEGRNKVVLAE